MTDNRTGLVAKRYAAERRFRLYGAAALTITATFLAVLILDIVTKGLPSFVEHTVTLPVNVGADKVDKDKIAAGDFDAMIKEAARSRFPDVKSRAERKLLNGLFSTGAADDLREAVIAQPSLIGQTFEFRALLSSDADLYFKGAETKLSRQKGTGTLTLAKADAGESSSDLPLYRLSGAANLSPGDIILAKGGKLRVTDAQAGLAEALAEPTSLDASAEGTWEVLRFSVPESQRRLNDKQILWLEELQSDGLVHSAFSWRFFESGDSREPELAGLRGAVIGSLLTVFVALGLALPLGVAAAIYLEQFAPRNRLTDLIEVNINNLAAVPSIIFGLLGLAMFLNFFGLPRSAPVVGGLVLALLVLPTIIIATRAALKAVPPSIIEAALGVGASHQQAVFQHVVPLALPGILTGTILAMARAFGETAPLLMIGMVAFIADVPHGFTDAATVLPVQIFLWSDLPEIGFQSKTAGAIIVLLVLLFCLNAVAVLLRKKFERRW